MAQFPILVNEAIVQVDDLTRLNASNSFVSTGSNPLTVIRIKPEASESFIDVTALQYLDWSYITAGVKTVTVELDDGIAAVTTKDFTITILTVADDRLFSGDQDIEPIERDILQWVKEGRTTYLDKHRVAQTYILDWLDQNGYQDANGDRLTKLMIAEISEVNPWSKYLTLSFIFEDISNQVDDIFQQKASRYLIKSQAAQKRVTIKLDLDEDGTVDIKQGLQFARLYRR